MIDSVVEALGKMGIKVYISGNSGNKEVGKPREDRLRVRLTLRERIRGLLILICLEGGKGGVITFVTSFQINTLEDASRSRSDQP